MNNIDLFRDNVKQLSKNNIVRLLTDVVLRDVDNIYNYETARIFYPGDVVYLYDDVEKKHKLYECITTSPYGIQGGTPFNPGDWQPFSIATTSHTNVTTSTFTIPSYLPNNMKEVFINQPGFNPAIHTLNVYHSVFGKYVKGIHIESISATVVYLKPEWALKKGETIILEVIR